MMQEDKERKAQMERDRPLLEKQIRERNTRLRETLSKMSL